MTVRERLHAWIDKLPKTELSKVAKRFGLSKEDDSAKDIAETISLWEALAEPIEDEQARAEFAEAVQRRPF
jgi:hypothetical protein